MRPLSFLAVLLAALAAAACGGSAAPQTPITFGIRGGNIAAYHVTIQADGSVRVGGARRGARRRISPAGVRRLRREIQGAHLVSRRCPGTLPDFAAQYIRADGRTVTVHGSCEPGFERVWKALVRATAVSRS